MVALDGDVTAQDYESEPRSQGHSSSTTDLLIVAVAVVAGVRSVGAVTTALIAALVCALLARRPAVVVLVVAGALFGSHRGEAAWAGLAPDQLGPFVGWSEVIDDPQPFEQATRVIVEIDGERFEIWARRTGQRARMSEWRAGEQVRIAGVRRALDDDRVVRVAWQHVVGEFHLDWATDPGPGGPLARASNRVRAAIERAAATMPGSDGALFRGLVVGDDRTQPREMIERFRQSGLSHLTAVSGQNVSFVLAAAGPMLRRARPGLRWMLTLGLVAWFVALTRFEPSIVRAGVMAGLSATAFALGRARDPVRMLALAVTGLVLVDPLLVWSIGFWLSVGATAGVSSVGPWLAARLEPFDPTGLMALPIGVTLGAQLGVVVPSVLVFGRLPLVSIPANLLAVPVAGAVMLVGLPAGLVAGWIPAVAPVVMFPLHIGVRWVDTVASLGARLEPDPPVQFVGWGAVVVLVAGLAIVGRRRETRTRPPE